MTAALILDGVQVRRGTATVVRGLSLEAERGAWFGIVGANGSGKTTLLRAIAGRLPIDAGSCRIDGVELARDRGGRAARIGFAPPIESLPAGLRFRDLLALAAHDMARARAGIGSLWEPLGIGALTDRWIGDCSSGMRQRASIALAFATGCPIVILDEPFNWLDPVAAFDTRTALGGKVAQGLTLVTALHDLTTLCGACDAGAVMTDGHVAMTLARDDLRAGAKDPAAFEERMIAALRSHPSSQ
ncbi:ABC transporter ATP-binding protein [Sphingomonas sp. LB-2]|uniref:ATP-binding cassette domain-containing protein n=1 Tax=Sphingomonas caeni TaxID=2984949 RepID=UPI00222EA6EB|nr:ABC transporter ATP-binding protein [Sphingomonas caeni]MCW3847859.1 ABC transporter ATP-binding protein [Sphingomonas caeni]